VDELAMKDFIISNKNGEIYAEIDYTLTNPEKYRCDGVIVSNSIPDSVLELIYEYNEIVNQGAMSIIDDVEEKIYDHDICLSSSGNRLFNICVYNNESRIFFYLKYPTSNGFRDKY
jgi:hypothetical protein